MGRTLITGGCGLLGSAVAERLLSDGEAVVVADLFEDTGDGRIAKEERSTRLMVMGASVVRVDLTDPTALWPLFADHRPSAIVNAALYAPDGQGLRPLVAVARTAGIGFFVHLSDAALYGDPSEPGLPAREDEPLPPKDDPSLRQKAAEEELVRESGMPYAILRVFHLIGPDFPAWRFPGGACAALLRGEEALLPDDEPRDFVHIDDAARAVQLALRSRPAGATINVGSGLPVRPSDLLRALATRSGTLLRYHVDDPAPKPVSRIAETSAAWNLLQFSAQKGIGDAVESIAYSGAGETSTTRMAGAGIRPIRRRAARAEEREDEEESGPRAVSRRDLFNIFRRPFDKG